MRARAGWVVRSIEGRRRRLVVDAVRRAAGARADRARVLDIGCEDGWIAEGYVDRVGETILCDLDARRLRESPLAQHPRVSILEDDALAPVHLARVLGSAGADVIVLSALLEHLPEPPRALEALQHHLAADGRFVIYLPADGPILFLKRVLKATRLGRLIKGLPLEPAPGHLHIFDRAATRALLAPFGTVTHLHFDPVCLGYVAIVAPEVTD